MLIPIHEYMERAYDRMPTYFTSNEFTKALREMECPETMIHKHQAKFLKERCQNHETRRTWKKELPQAVPPKKTKKKEVQNLGLIRRLIKWIY